MASFVRSGTSGEFELPDEEGKTMNRSCGTWLFIPKWVSLKYK